MKDKKEMKNKIIGVGVFAEVGDGEFYLVRLSKGEEKAVILLISQLHGGSIEVFDDKQPLERLKPRQNSTRTNENNKEVH